MNIYYKLTSDYGRLPISQTVGALCFDLYTSEKVVFEPFAKGVKVPFGIATAIPQGYALILAPRSSTGTKTPLRMSNSIGIIDSDYRGEICAIFDNTSEYNYEVLVGDRLVQGFLIPKIEVNWIKVDELDDTDRGDGGFGSTGR